MTLVIDEANLRNPAWEHALNLADLQDTWNYSRNGTSDAHSQPWLRFFVVKPHTRGVEFNDAFVDEPRLAEGEWVQWSWDSTEGDGATAPRNLAELGIVPFRDGTWSERYCVAADQAFKLVSDLIAQRP